MACVWGSIGKGFVAARSVVARKVVGDSRFPYAAAMLKFRTSLKGVSWLCDGRKAGVVELADTLDLGSSAARRAGSSPVSGISHFRGVF